MEKTYLFKDIDAAEKIFFVILFFCSISIAFDFFMSIMYSRMFTFGIIGAALISFVAFLMRRLRPRSFQTVFWFIDIQALSLFLVFILMIVGTGLASPLSWLYEKYWYLYVLLFLLAPIIVEFYSGMLSFHKRFPREVRSSVLDNRISDKKIVYILSSRKKKKDDKNKMKGLGVFAGSVGSGLGLYWGYQLGLHYVLYVCFLGILPIASTVLHIVLARRWGIYKTFGFKDIKIDFTEKPLMNASR